MPPTINHTRLESIKDDLKGSGGGLKVDIVSGGGGGGGTEYTEGATDATITGTAILWEDTADTLRSVSAAKPLPTSVASLPLPTGAATAALQTQPGVDIGDVTINNAAGAAAVNIQDGGNSITVDATALPLPTGAATSANQATEIASLASIDAGIPAALGQAAMAASMPVVVASNQSPIPVDFAPAKQTSYSAASAAFTPGATPQDVFTITGSATKTVKIYRMILSGTSSSAAVGTWFIRKRSTANTGGTSAAVTRVPHDSNDAAATATILQYTANPTAGTLVGDVWSGKIASLTVSPTNPANLLMEVDFVQLFGKPITLRGITQVLAWNFNGVALPGGLSLNCVVCWTEE